MSKATETLEKTEETPETHEIKKPWIVYNHFGAVGFGKIIYYFNSMPWAKSTENHHEDPQLVDLKQRGLNDPIKARAFDDPIKAIAYFLHYQNPLFESPYTKQEAITFFLNCFPSQRPNLEEYLNQPSSLLKRNFDETDCKSLEDIEAEEFGTSFNKSTLHGIEPPIM